jgi:hypothetical protein
MPDQKQGQLASLIISIIILIIVIILIIIVCCGYNNNQSSPPLVQNPQALAAAYAYAHRNKDNFFNEKTSQCQGKNIGSICTIDQQVGKCEMYSGWGNYVCCQNNQNECFSHVI